MKQLIFPAILGVLPLLTAAGCGTKADDGRIAVSGKVTRDGQPLSVGQIVFTPADKNMGPAAGTDIRDGEYQINAAEGPGSGAYTITVTTGGPPRKKFQTVSSETDGSSMPQERQVVKFRRTISEDDGENEVNLDVTSDGPSVSP